MVATPIAIPSGRPAPPAKATPPRIAAVKTSNSKPAAYGWRNTAEPSGDQNCNEPNQKTVDGVKPDDRAGNRNPTEFSRPRVAADGVEAEPSHGAGKYERADNEHGDRDNNRILDCPNLAPAEFQQRWWETVDRDAANDVGETAIEGQHGERHDQRGDAQLAHQNPVDQAEKKAKPETGRDRQRRFLRHHGDLGDDDPNEGHHAADGEIHIARDQQRRSTQHGDQDRR